MLKYVKQLAKYFTGSKVVVSRQASNKGKLISDIMDSGLVKFSEFTIAKIIGTLEGRSVKLKGMRFNYNIEKHSGYIVVNINNETSWKISTTHVWDYGVL